MDILVDRMGAPISIAEAIVIVIFTVAAVRGALRGSGAVL